MLAVAPRRLVAPSTWREGRPYLLECRTYRFRAHSMFDANCIDPRKKSRSGRNATPQITLFVAQMQNAGVLRDEDVRELEHRVEREVADAVAFAEAGTWEPVEDLTRFVLFEKSRP